MARETDARERLVTAAAAAMHERGYTAVGVAEICARAGVNKGSFYHFFPTKRALGLAVVDVYATRLETALAAMLVDAGPPLDRLHAFLEGGYRSLQEEREDNGACFGCALGNLAIEMSAQDDALRDRLREVFDGWVRAYGTLVREAVDRGDVPVCDTTRMAEALVALHEGRIMLAKLRDDPSAVRGLGDEALRVLSAAPAASGAGGDGGHDG